MSHAAQAYARTSQTTASPREIEAQALLKAARQLQDVQANWTGPDKNMHQALLFQSTSGDPGLDAVLSEIELRVEVELAKTGQF